MKVRFYEGNPPNESFLFEQEITYIPHRKDIVWYESPETLGEPYQVEEVHHFFDGDKEEAIEVFVSSYDIEWGD